MNKKNSIALIWLIFWCLFLLLSFSHIYLSFTSIKIWENSPVFQNIKQGSEPLQQPLIDLVKVYNSSSRITNFFSGIGLFLAALTALFSYKLENKKLDKKFFISSFIVIILFLGYLVIVPPSRLSPCIGCIEISLSRTGEGCFKNQCFEFPDQTKGIIRNDCNSSNWIVGTFNWKGEKIIFDEYKLKKGELCQVTAQIE